MIVAAQTGIAGSTKIGKNCQMADKLVLWDISPLVIMSSSSSIGYGTILKIMR